MKFNNIAELRLLFALCVVVSHTIQLAGFKQYDAWRLILSSEVAVQAFFILSGFLVLGSYARTPQIGGFYLRRILRIYPAYVVAVLLFLALGIAQARSLGAEVRFSEVGRYLVANLSLLNFLQPGVTGVFHSHAYTEINGALWTIKIEMMFYALVPLLHACGRRWSFRLVAAMLMIIGLCWRPLLDLLQASTGQNIHPSLAHQLPGQLHFFGLGVLLFDLANRPAHRFGNAWIALGAVLLACTLGDMRAALQMLLVSLFIFAATHMRQWRTPFEDADFSYGVYLSHFPIIQLLIGAGAASLGAGGFLALVLVLATAYAMASWHRVERPALQLTRNAAA